MKNDINYQKLWDKMPTHWKKIFLMNLYEDYPFCIDFLKSYNEMPENFVSEGDFEDLSTIKEIICVRFEFLTQKQFYFPELLLKLPNLTKLELHRNQISDISPLKKLTNLCDLNLKGNPINPKKLEEKLPNANILF